MAIFCLWISKLLQNIALRQPVIFQRSLWSKVQMPCYMKSIQLANSLFKEQLEVKVITSVCCLLPARSRAQQQIGRSLLCLASEVKLYLVRVLSDIEAILNGRLISVVYWNICEVPSTSRAASSNQRGPSMKHQCGNVWASRGLLTEHK